MQVKKTLFNNLFNSTLLMVVWVVLTLGYAQEWLPVWDAFKANNSPYKQGFNVGVCLTVALFYTANTVRLYTARFAGKKIKN